MRTTVQIIGKGPNAAAAPRGVERWCCNDLQRRIPEGWSFDAWDRWFDRHTKGHIQRHRMPSWDWYTRNDGRRPIYGLQAYSEIPGSVAYPTAQVQAAFPWGGQAEEFFTSSVDWMLALAIVEGAPRIELYGVDLYEARHERGEQRCGAHYWIGIARGRGIDVHIPDESSLCKIERMYGCFTPTSARNFCSMSMSRFIAQCQAADRQRAPGYVPDGVDEPALVA